jgi:DNA gyrase/topoisomerase IV subunit A
VGLVRIPVAAQGEPDLAEPDLLTVTEHGFGKRTNLREYLVASEGEDGAVTLRRQSRGGKGRIDIRTSNRNGQVVASYPSNTEPNNPKLLADLQRALNTP